MKKLLIVVACASMMAGCASIQEVSNSGLCKSIGVTMALSEDYTAYELEFKRRVEVGTFKSSDQGQCQRDIAHGIRIIQECYRKSTPENLNWCIIGARLGSRS